MNTGLSFVCRDENGFKDNSYHCVCVLPFFSLALCLFISACLSVLFFCVCLLGFSLIILLLICIDWDQYL